MAPNIYRMAWYTSTTKTVATHNTTVDLSTILTNENASWRRSFQGRKCANLKSSFTNVNIGSDVIDRVCG